MWVDIAHEDCWWHLFIFPFSLLFLLIIFSILLYFPFFDSSHFLFCLISFLSFILSYDNFKTLFFFFFFFFLLPWLPSVHLSFDRKYPTLGRLVLIFTFLMNTICTRGFSPLQSYTEYTSPTGTSNEFIKKELTIFVPVKIFCESSMVQEKSSVKRSWKLLHLVYILTFLEVREK